MRSATGFEPSDKWFGEQAVYRISMGNFVSSLADHVSLQQMRYAHASSNACSGAAF
jgi:hypothetical protein